MECSISTVLHYSNQYTFTPCHLRTHLRVGAGLVLKKAESRWLPSIYGTPFFSFVKRSPMVLGRTMRITCNVTTLVAFSVVALMFRGSLCVIAAVTWFCVLPRHWLGWYCLISSECYMICLVDHKAQQCIRAVIAHHSLFEVGRSRHRH